MLFEENRRNGGPGIEGYESGRLNIGGREYTTAVRLLEDECQPCPEALPAELDARSFTACFEGRARPEVILVGTGEKQQFLPPKTVAALAARGIGLECMTTAAACRTFMILQGEGRRVWAWLWP
ncbi:MAG: Mth938-like domain-containing protein [Neisseria sp.]|nr:Mth938-like domain-containing protein [Neisseria sp.]